MLRNVLLALAGLALAVPAPAHAASPLLEQALELPGFAIWEDRSDLPNPEPYGHTLFDRLDFAMFSGLTTAANQILDDLVTR